MHFITFHLFIFYYSFFKYFLLYTYLYFIIHFFIIYYHSIIYIILFIFYYSLLFNYLYLIIHILLFISLFFIIIHLFIFYYSCFIIHYHSIIYIILFIFYYTFLYYLSLFTYLYFIIHFFIIYYHSIIYILLFIFYYWFSIVNIWYYFMEFVLFKRVFFYTFSRLRDRLSVPQKSNGSTVVVVVGGLRNWNSSSSDSRDLRHSAFCLSICFSVLRTRFADDKRGSEDDRNMAKDRISRLKSLQQSSVIHYDNQLQFHNDNHQNHVPVPVRLVLSGTFLEQLSQKMFLLLEDVDDVERTVGSW